MVCANHSSVVDPIFIALALGRNDQPLFIAKEELFRVPVFSWLIKKLGAISVDRSKTDIGPVKTSLQYLKKGVKVVIFPEGARVAEDDTLDAKRGAIRIAERSGAYILPVYIPRKKTVFSRVRIVVGKPYKIEKQKEKRTPEEYDRLSNEMMKTIQELKEFAI